MLRVLIIDDEEDMRVLASVFLEMDGMFEVLAASTGEAGISLAVEQQPDAILLDYMMPGMDGPATLASLKENPETRGIPVIFLSAKAETEKRAELIAMGAAGAIGKPFDPSKLAGDVSRIILSAK